MKHASAWTTSKAAPGPAGTTTSPSSPSPTPSDLQRLGARQPGGRLTSTRSSESSNSSWPAGTGTCPTCRRRLPPDTHSDNHHDLTEQY